jgi:hypothetical protein
MIFIHKHLKLCLSSELKTISQKLRVNWKGLPIHVCVLCAKFMQIHRNKIRLLSLSYIIH